MMNILQCLLAAASIAVSGNEVYGDRFVKNAPEAYLKNPGKQLKFEKDGVNGNTIVSDTSFAVKEVRVTPRTKYRLSFVASRSGGTSFESGLMDTMTLFQYRGSKYPVLRLRFADASGKTVPHDNPVLTIYSAEPEKYTCLFYTPSGTENFSALFEVPRGIALRLADLRLEEEKTEKTLNINGDFALGLYNYSGIASANDETLRLLRNEQGKICFFTGFYAYTTRCPIDPGKKYTLALTGTGYYRNRVDSFLLFWKDSDWKKPLLKTDLPRLSKGNKGHIAYQFTAPQDARWVSLWIYHATISEIRLSREE